MRSRQAAEQSATKTRAEIQRRAAVIGVSGNDFARGGGTKVGNAAAAVDPQQTSNALRVPAATMRPEVRRTAEQLPQCLIVFEMIDGSPCMATGRNSPQPRMKRVGESQSYRGGLNRTRLNQLAGTQSR